MSQSEIVRTGVAVAIVFGIYKFVKNDAVKAAALGVLGTIVARQIPYVQDAVGG